MPKTRLDQMVEVYAEHIMQFDHSESPSAAERKIVYDALKNSVLSDERDVQVQQMKKEVRKEARSYKQSLFKKVRTGIIIETIFVAFLVGLIVNQVTYLLPEGVQWAGGIIIVSLLVCVLFILIETGKD